MDINWNKIKEKLRRYCTSAFAENRIVVTPEELEEDIDIFYNFVSLSLPFPEIGNIRNEMLYGLQKACIDEIGEVPPLKTVATLFDTYMKKLICYADIASFESIKGKMQMDLLKQFGYWGMVIPSFEDNTIESLKGNADARYLLGMTILTRNKVHNAPIMDDSEVTNRLKCVVAFYIYLVHKNKQKLLRKKPELAKHDLHYFENNEENALLYDYISYGNSSVQIKKRYVSTYAKHQLYRKSPLSEQELLAKMQSFSENTLKEPAVKRLMVELESNNDITPTSKIPKRYSLSDRERERIHDAEDNYNLSLNSFNASMSEAMSRYGLRVKVEDMTKLLMEYLAAQYNYDIDEAIGDIENVEKPSYKTFTAKLKDLGCPTDKCKDLFKELLCISRDNDVIVRVSAGKAFRRISNPDQFNEYVRRADRKVWLDTQILLYLLCHNDDYAKYDHPTYKTAMALFHQPPGHDNFHFKVAHFYLNELTSHLRQALLLINIVDLPFAKNRNMSNNVFYRHYRKLHDADGLPYGIDTFADYLEDNFHVTEDEAFAPDFENIAEGVIEAKLAEFNIESEWEDQQSPKDMKASEDVFRSLVKTNSGLVPKSGKTLLNDAWMGLCLFKHNEEQKPLFITMDNQFEPYRRQYIDRYKRGASFNWHLFSPAEFVNHIDFINFKVNADNLTDSLISIIETSEMKDKTINVIDSISRFLDIPDMSSGQRKKYVTWVNELFQSEEFAYKTGKTKNEDFPDGIIRFLDAQDGVFTYFSEKNDESMKDFQRMLQVEDNFKIYLEVLSSYVSTETANMKDLILTVEGNLEDFLKPNTKPTAQG